MSEKMREAFEDWAYRNMIGLAGSPNERLAWLAWCAALAEQPAQGELVGWLYRGGGPRPVSDADEWKYWHGPERPVLAWDHQEIKPVYTAPTAQHAVVSTAPSVPDFMTDDPSWDEFSEVQMAYRDGWNACRAAMLAAAPEVQNNANKLSLVHVVHSKNAEDTWVTSSELKGMLESGWVVAGPVHCKTT